MDKKRKSTADFWSKLDCSSSDKNFYSFPPFRARSCQMIFGEDDARRGDWCIYWTVEKYLKSRIPFGRALSICCGFGALERCLAKMQVAQEITGIDIAPGAIEKAKALAQEEGFMSIEYRVSDINMERLPENSLDLIWANGALHHIEDLRRVIPMLYAALRKGGYLIANEYVGPCYQQIGNRQQEVVNAVKHLLPRELRERPSDSISFAQRGREFAKQVYFNGLFSKKIYRQIWYPVPKRWFLRNDPSECVNSPEIIPELQRTFEEVDVRYFGGSILAYALDNNFYDNFDPENERHRAILEMIFTIEDTLLDTGEIPNDNAHIICQKR